MLPPSDYNPPGDVGSVQYSVHASRVGMRNLGVPKEKGAILIQK